MDILFIIYTYNRVQILNQCINTLFGNTSIKPDEALIIDDASDPQLRVSLSEVGIRNQQSFPINIMQFNKNQGLGYQFEFGLRYAQYRNPKYLVHVESDYLFSQGWLETVLAVLEARPLTVGISGYSNPDFYQRDKTEEMFPRIMKDDFGADLVKREFLHKPFDLDTKIGKVQVQLTSNSCGTFILNWKRVQELFSSYPEMQRTVFDRACNKQPGGNRRYAGDGPLTGGLSHYWYKDQLEHSCLGLYSDLSVDKIKEEHDKFYSTNAPWLDICDYSISQHLNGGGLNSGGLPEGSTFVGSPKWDNSFLTKNPRQA